MFKKRALEKRGNSSCVFLEKLPVMCNAFSSILLVEVKAVQKNNPVEFSKEFLDERNLLTGPDDAGKASYPKAPNHVSIKSRNSKKNKH